MAYSAREIVQHICSQTGHNLVSLSLGQSIVPATPQHDATVIARAEIRCSKCGLPPADIIKGFRKRGK